MADKSGLIHPEGVLSLVSKYMKNATAEQKKEFTDIELRRFKNETTINSWCHKAPFEQLLYTYTLLGGDFLMLFYQDENDIDKSLAAMHGIYDHPEKRKDTIQKIAAAGIAAVTSFEFIRLGMLLELNCKTGLYQLTPLAKKMPGRIKEFKRLRKALRSREDDDERNANVNKAQSALDDAISLALTTMNANEHLLMTYGLTTLHMRILLFLHKNRNDISNDKNLMEGLKMKGQKSVILKGMRQLIDDRLVIFNQKRGLDMISLSSTTFRITGKGEKIANEFTLYLHEETFKNDPQ